MILEEFKPKSKISVMLEQAGVAPKPPDADLSRKGQFADALTKHGASLPEIASAIGQALNDEKQRIPASRLALEGHGVINDKSAPTPPMINIVINDQGSTRNILDLVMP